MYFLLLTRLLQIELVQKVCAIVSQLSIFDSKLETLSNLTNQMTKKYTVISKERLL